MCQDGGKERETCWPHLGRAIYGWRRVGIWVGRRRVVLHLRLLRLLHRGLRLVLCLVPGTLPAGGRAHALRSCARVALAPAVSPSLCDG